MTVRIEETMLDMQAARVGAALATLKALRELAALEGAGEMTPIRKVVARDRAPGERKTG